MLAHYRVKSTVQLRHRRIFRGRVARRSFTAGLPEPWGWPTPGRADPLRYYRGPRHGAIDCLQRAVGHRPHATPTSGSRQTGAPPGSWVVNTPLTPTAPDMQVFGGSMPITITAQSPTPAVPDSGVFAIPTVTATSSERADDAVTRARRKRAGYSMMAGVRHCGEYAAGDYSRY